MTEAEDTGRSAVEDLRGALKEVGADTGALPKDVRQELMRLAVTSFAAAWQEGAAQPLASPTDITATDAVVVASALIKAQNVELFELAMWQTQVGA